MVTCIYMLFTNVCSYNSHHVYQNACYLLINIWPKKICRSIQYHPQRNVERVLHPGWLLKLKVHFTIRQQRRTWYNIYTAIPRIFYMTNVQFSIYSFYLLIFYHVLVAQSLNNWKDIRTQFCVSCYSKQKGYW